MSAQSFPTMFGRATSIYSQHSGLLKTSNRLRRACVSLTDNASVDIQDVIRLIQKFRSQLALHFELEERDGYFGTLLAECPHLYAEVEGLQTEHEIMLGGLKALVTEPGSPSDLRTRMEEILDQFETHERRENALLQEFFTRDAGGEGG